MNGIGRIEAARGPLPPEAGGEAGAAAAPEAVPVEASVGRDAVPADRMSVLRGLGDPTPRFGSGPLEGLSVQEVADHVGQAPRADSPAAQKAFLQVSAWLDGRVSNLETRHIIEELDQLQPSEWLAVMDRLARTPWKKGRSLFEKLVVRGVEDSNDLIAAFASQADEKLALGLPTLRDRILAAHAEGAPTAGASRLPQESMRRDAAAILDYFGIDHHQPFGRGLLNAFERRGDKRAGADDHPHRAHHHQNRILPRGAGLLILFMGLFGI